VVTLGPLDEVFGVVVESHTRPFLPPSFLDVSPENDGNPKLE
jgi:hypothetical protein